MKKIFTFLFLVLFFLDGKTQINYAFTAVNGSWAANSSPTVLFGANYDDYISSQTNIGFNFCYGGLNYTTFQASTNGVMFLGTNTTASNLTNDLNTSTDRPALAPLWDDLETGTGGSLNYQLTGTAPNRVLIVEWNSMFWNYAATNPSISFQVKLYEGTNVIEFIYSRIGNAGADVNSPSASIGISGPTSGDYYSLDNTSNSPTASKTIETSTITNPKPATGQVYRWTPPVCSGIPTGGTAIANPNNRCSNYTTTLSLTGSTNACGITYQWQSGPSATGPWTPIASATAITATAAVTATTYYRCIVACGASTVASSVAGATLTASGTCGICGINSITLPYSVTGVTTCGAVNDVTSGNVSNVCGSVNYYSGEDVVYTFTPTASGQINIGLTSSGSYASLMLYQGCPVSGGTCVGNSQSSSGNQSLCPNVTAGVTYYLVIDSYSTFSTCNPYNLNISAPNGVACNMNYSASTTTYNFENFSGTLCPSTDDVLYSNTISFGFPMCYDGRQYYGGYIASNSTFVFDAVPCFPNIQTTTYAAAGVSTGFSIGNPAPINGTSIPRNAILAPWHDIHPGLGGTIQYTTTGTAPNRKFVVSYENVPMYSCGTSSPSIYFSGQIKLFETTNDIEIHIKNKGVCPGFNNGQAILGLHNYNGTTYVPPVNATIHNATATTPYNQWSMTNTAYKFVNNCGPICAAILPIHFEKFYGERVEKVNHLYWNTAEEQNIASFKVERSLDAQNFTEIGKVNPSNKPSKYSFDDHEPVSGMVNYYRITSVEQSGERKSTFIYPLGANEREVMVSGVYPNPVRSSFTIGVDSKIITEATITIYDSFGKVVKTESKSIGTGASQLNIDAMGLASGVYLLEVTNAGKELLSKQKLVKID